MRTQNKQRNKLFLISIFLILFLIFGCQKSNELMLKEVTIAHSEIDFQNNWGISHASKKKLYQITIPDHWIKAIELTAIHSPNNSEQKAIAMISFPETTQADFYHSNQQQLYLLVTTENRISKIILFGSKHPEKYDRHPFNSTKKYRTIDARPVNRGKRNNDLFTVFFSNSFIRKKDTNLIDGQDNMDTFGLDFSLE